ncbi:hypothetical protein FHL15_005488 [Xylaria flabelliformis]|uniref:DUF7730 domain-containing protein n=1 Tax=Xylaria flabelliformis TaxID=2512241 RepID=A0A553HZY3_9PEZI|nr:hypothetical protein FHL15_005488 [Xylaria flabelliformis]
MAISVSSRLKSYLRQKLEKTRKCNAQTPTDSNKKERRDLTSPPTPKTIKPDISIPKTRLDEQNDSPFFQKLPLEIRKMIYAYVWQGPCDHMYHESNGRHLHFKDGHWVHTRCVMYQEDDEDLDLIQKQMDLIRDTGRGDLLLWQRRLASTWGQRHWRCAERIEYGRPTSIDRTDLGALMIACKKMHPEVIESFIECHKIIFNDVFSAYRFLLRPGSSRPIRHLRNLDLTLSLRFHELAPFMAIGPSETDDNDDIAERTTLLGAKNSRLGAILDALAEYPTCLHSLRISLDVYDRGPWRKIPERALASHLARIPVRRGKRGEVNYIVELPSALPIRTHYAGLQELEDVGEAAKVDKNRVESAFEVIRRPALRYWQFNPGEVEHFTWETCHGEKRHQHCWIALSKATRLISNPYLIDFAER